MLLYPSEQWIAEWMQRADADRNLRDTLATWQGDVGLVTVAGREATITENLYVWFDPTGGRFTDWAWGEPRRTESATVVLGGSYEAWKAVVKAEVNPLKAVILGSIRIRAGRLTRLLSFQPAFGSLQALARSIETRFVDEP